MFRSASARASTCTWSRPPADRRRRHDPSSAACSATQRRRAACTPSPTPSSALRAGRHRPASPTPTRASRAPTPACCSRAPPRRAAGWRTVDVGRHDRPSRILPFYVPAMVASIAADLGVRPRHRRQGQDHREGSASLAAARASRPRRWRCWRGWMAGRAAVSFLGMGPGEQSTGDLEAPAPEAQRLCGGRRMRRDLRWPSSAMCSSIEPRGGGGEGGTNRC